MIGPDRTPLFAVVADVHVTNPRWRGGPMEGGVNRRGRMVLDTLATAVRLAQASGAKALFVAGDLFDSSRATPQLVAAAMDALQSTVDVHVVVGNHDQESTGEGDHALAPLAHVGNVRVHEQPSRVLVHDAEVLVVPFQPTDARVYIPEAVRRLGSVQGNPVTGALGQRVTSRVLVIHAGIIDAATPTYLQGATDAIEVDALAKLCVGECIDVVYAGNWHEHRVWSRTGVAESTMRPVTVVQVGALVPTDFRNAGLVGYGSVAWWDGVKAWREELGGPRFVTVRDRAGFDAALRALKITKGAGREAQTVVAAFPLYLRWTVDDPAELDAAGAAMREEVELGLLLGGEVLPGDKAARTAARTAAATVRAAGSLREAVVAHVGGVEVPEGVTRDEVRDAALGYLGVG